MSHEGQPPSGRRRFFRLAGLSASMAGRYAGHAVANRFRNEEQRRRARDALHSRSGQDLALTLGELKGAVMKLGQLASQTAEFLPESIAEPLKGLQKQAPPMPGHLARKQVEMSLGAPIDELFQSFDEQHHAAASIGQVHPARLHDGREVVVKLQYPGVAASCDTDLNQFKQALRAARLLNVSKAVLDEMFEEIRARLHEELDYVNEAKNMHRFAAFFAAEDKIIIPQVIEALSNAEVLTMTRESGDDLDQLDDRYDQPLRNELSLRLFHFMCRSLFELGQVHADPNPGNFAYRTDGSLVVYDFGCIKAVDADTVQAYRRTVRAGLDRDWSGVEAGLLALGARVPGSPPVEDAFYAAWHPIVLQPFLGDKPFDFATSRIHRQVMAKSPEMLERLHQFQPPTRTLYLDRMVGGHYWTLVRLGGRLALEAELRPYLNQDPARGHP